uniref:Retrovirus-related Pol polyprotein from transposon TNT 1-94 n=1 Tax=Tanacetum cinerariifolium TaxID=118510 RepID=A0A6L2MZ73_TANCI|nr:retrovirus-related Pol polyprotein from transposon TNT 1-94 [Tanacetum cinerariifolium]
MVACCRGLDEFLSWLFVGRYRENDMVIHSKKIGMKRLMVEIGYVGKIADVVDKATWSFYGLQPEQVDLKKGSKESRHEHVRKEMQESKDNNEDDDDDTEDSNMDIYENGSNKGDDDAMHKIESFKKRSHNDHDPPNDHEGEKRKKRINDAGKYASRSSKKDKSPMDLIQEDIPAEQPQENGQDYKSTPKPMKKMRTMAGDGIKTYKEQSQDFGDGVLRRLGSIFTSVYVVVQKQKKAFEFKFKGDNTLIVIQPPCYSASKDFQDSPDDEDDTRSSQEYMNDLEEEYQERALLAKSKRFFKKAKYNKTKAKLALLSFSATAPISSSGKNKGLIAESYDWDEEEVSSDENEITEVKALMALTDEERVFVGKESARNAEWIKISMKKVSITGSNNPKLFEVEDSTLSSHDTGKRMNLQSVAPLPLPPLKKLTGVEPVSGSKT